MRRRKLLLSATAAAAALGLSVVPAMANANAAPPSNGTATPIQHLVVIFQENVSFDHYFGTYPVAENLPGENPFNAAPGTPSVNGLSGGLLTSNPNLSNPQRLSPAEAATCDQDHGYTHEQSSFDNGKMDKFVQDTGKGLTLQQCLSAENNPAKVTDTSPDYAVMDYYDGNTVTALWNYAQHFAMSDNSYSTTFGPSTPGAINVTAGNTFGAVCGPSFAVINAPTCTTGPTPTVTSAQAGHGTDYSDADPLYDVCSDNAHLVGTYNPASNIAMGGSNVGDQLNNAGISWGWFQGGFAAPGYVPGQPSTDNLSAVCTSKHTGASGSPTADYSPHHEPFQYYASTANPDHLPPTSIAMIGQQDQANHQYDLSDFWAAADSGNLPAVSYLKAPAYEDGHAGYSDPTLEQQFLASTVNQLESLPSWKTTAVVIAYDDSDGWYDHQMGPIITPSQTTLDTLTGPDQCGTSVTAISEPGKCGVGPRQPLLVISPFSKRNFVDHTFTDQTSVVRFIEDNWLGGARIGNGDADASAGSLGSMFNFGHQTGGPLFLNPATGEVEQNTQ